MTKKKKAPSLSEFIANENNTQDDFSFKENTVETKITKTVKETIIKDSKTTKLMTFNIPVKVKKQLEELWFAERESGQTQTDLILEGLDLLFKKRGLPAIKDIIK